MNYITASDFRDQATGRDLDALLSDLGDTAAQDAWIEKKIPAVCSDFDGYASSRYTLPLVADDQVKELAAQLLFFKVLHRRPETMTDADRDDEKALLQRLRDISPRKFNLVGQTEIGSVAQSTSARETAPSARAQGRKRIFTRDKMGGF